MRKKLHRVSCAAGCGKTMSSREAQRRWVINRGPTFTCPGCDHQREQREREIRKLAAEHGIKLQEIK